MSHESHEQLARNEVSATVETQPVTETSQAVTVAAEDSESKQPEPAKATSKKPAAKGKPARKAAAERKPEPAKLEKAAKDKKEPARKSKLVRDSFTLPETDYALFETLKQRALAAGAEVKKSELLRAALATLAKLDDAEFIKTVGSVERIKPGRPKK